MSLSELSMFDKFLKEIKIFRDNIFLDSLKQYLNTYSEELRSRNCEVICFCDGASSKCPKNFSIFLGAGAAILIFPKKLHGNEKLSLSYEGYIFKNEPTFKLNVVTQNNVIIATILCCFNPNTTNQKMEVGIFIEVLNELKNLNIKSGIIISDSNYTVTGYNDWLPNWLKVNFKSYSGKPIQNLKEWKLVRSVQQGIEKHNISIIVEWVKAHQKNTSEEFKCEHQFNNIVDRIAGSVKDALKEYISNFDITECEHLVHEYFKTSDIVIKEKTDKELSIFSLSVNKTIGFLSILLYKIDRNFIKKIEYSKLDNKFLYDPEYLMKDFNITESVVNYILQENLMIFLDKSFLAKNATEFKKYGISLDILKDCGIVNDNIKIAFK